MVSSVSQDGLPFRSNEASMHDHARAHPMSVPRPHFLLFCDGSLPNQSEGIHRSHRGRWRFVLENVEGNGRLEASDAESSQAPDRLALLAVVRGLEALEQPSRVTLVTSSRYVNRGLQYGLPEWRENQYCWEHFGSLQPIRNADLWQRIDRALKFHSIHCRLMSGEEVEEESLEGHSIESHPHVEMTSKAIEEVLESNEVQEDFAGAAIESDLLTEENAPSAAPGGVRRGFQWLAQWSKTWFGNRYVLAAV